MIQQSTRLNHTQGLGLGVVYGRRVEALDVNSLRLGREHEEWLHNQAAAMTKLQLVWVCGRHAQLESVPPRLQVRCA